MILSSVSGCRERKEDVLLKDARSAEGSSSDKQGLRTAQHRIGITKLEDLLEQEPRHNVVEELELVEQRSRILVAHEHLQQSLRKAG